MDPLDQLTPDVPEVGLEPGITRMVGILSSKGLATAMSCAGHHDAPGKSNAWIQIQPACFKHYMKTGADKMGQFLRVGEGLWFLRVEYSGRSRFRGLGQTRPRTKSLKRVVMVEMTPTIVLRTTALDASSGKATKSMRAMERAAQRSL